MSAPIENLTGRLGHLFKDASLLEAALTHPGANGRPKGTPSAYERLEFLGDRVLGLAIAEWLYALHPSEAEGALAKRLTALVNRDALYEVAASIGLGTHLKLANGEQAIDDAPQTRTILADAMEALIGALYLDAGLEVARDFIHRHWHQSALEGSVVPADPKTALQEWAQGKGLPLPLYTIVEQSGPSHAPKFVVKAEVAKHGAVEAEGASKRAAEKEAAQRLLEQILKST